MTTPAALNATATIAPSGSGPYSYTITLSDTGNTTIGTFWFGWIPGFSFMTQNPTSIGSPAGWSESIVPESGGYSIEWTANSSASYLQPNGSSSAFTFSSAETPTQLAANSPVNTTYPSTTSFVYSGGAFVSSGLQFTATINNSSPPVEAATATMSSLEVTPGVFNYTIDLTDTGTTNIATFWFAWDDVPDQDFMNGLPSNIGVPSGWSETVTTHNYVGGTGYGILWTSNGAPSDLTPSGSSNAFTFTSSETPAQFAAVSQFDNTFQTTSSFVYSGAPEATAGGNLVVAVACFREGTGIRVPSGEVAVETLRPGDHVLTATGEWRPLRWVGRRRIDCARHPRPAEVWPVRVAAGALDDQSPHTDLYLSPDHALFLHGVLVPVKHLINGTTIAAVPVDAVIWHHLELASHDVILAEGAPAETYLDTGDRAKFDGEVATLFPTAGIAALSRTMREAASHMTVVATGPILAAIRRQIADRASLLATDELAA